jgi:uncharacterized protein (TIGR02284 family)
MATGNENIASTLNELIETARDGEEGFRQAAEKAKDPALQNLFRKYSNQRASFAVELQQLVESLGEKPSTSGHASATLHRGWIGLKAAVAKNEDKALIDECETGEDAAVKAYNQAVAKSLPAQIQTVVHRQYAGRYGLTLTPGSLRVGQELRLKVELLPDLA